MRTSSKLERAHYVDGILEGNVLAHNRLSIEKHLFSSHHQPASRRRHHLNAPHRSRANRLTKRFAVGFNFALREPCRAATVAQFKQNRTHTHTNTHCSTTVHRSAAEEVAANVRTALRTVVIA